KVGKKEIILKFCLGIKAPLLLKKY
ncbi:uncharacterized protein METZ01_LOCUS439056, partial [marine metagenome]